MNHKYTIHYQDFANELETSKENNEHRYEASKGHPWGTYSESNIALNHIRIYEAQIHLNKEFRVLYTDDRMSNEVHFCANMNGNIEGAFCGNKIKKLLKASQHHCIYAPDADYELSFKDIHYVHLAIDRNYYIRLLANSDSWLDRLRSQLVKQEEVYPGGIALHSSMKRILLTMMQTPLSGSLRDLMLEAKVLELIALQLGQYAEGGVTPDKIKRRDQELFQAIKEHLGKTFHQDHSLESLSREFGINEFKLKQGFRQNFGTSVFAFILDAKMNHARQLILDEGMYVHEASGKVGYKNPNHFSTAFKKKFGFSPNKLRE